MSSNLFENLMHYNATKQTSKKKITESNRRKPTGRRIVEEDETLLNIGLTIPNDVDELTPEDIDVNVGVMDVELDEYDDTIDEVPAESSENEPDDEPEPEENESDEKEENLQRTTEDVDNPEENPENPEPVPTEEPAEDPMPEEPTSVSPAESALNTLNDLYAQIDDLGLDESRNTLGDIVNGLGWVVDITAYKTVDEIKKYCKLIIDTLKQSPDMLSIKTEGKDCKNCDGEKEEECNEAKKPEESEDDEKNKKKQAMQERRLRRQQERLNNKNESLLHLDNNSLNKLITNFVKDNYKNIDKVTISRAVLENKKTPGLKISGKIYKENGSIEKFTLRNIGFDPKLLEGKTFIMDFEDVSKTFGVIRESKKYRNPFRVKASITEGVVKFTELKYGFNTKLAENKIVNLHGKYTLNG